MEMVNNSGGQWIIETTVDGKRMGTGSEWG
jgi:hypothetical protein